MVKQIVMNLLTNAVKFTPSGGRIKIGLHADKSGFTIVVRDDGIGIAGVDLERIREPFVQVDSSLSRRQEGTGLGLSIVEMLIRQHAGVLELESQQGSGTTVRVRFPPDRVIWRDERRASEATLCDLSEEAVPIAAEPWETSGRPRILVVEDDRNLCDLLTRMLERSGFFTAAASNGREALRHLASKPVELLITDMVMPEMDGVELMRVLQRDRPNLPIIALSGVEDFEEYQRMAAHLGARLALRKPVTRADLTSAVKEVLRHHSDKRIPQEARVSRT
jgi:CheY-like chemotaxis protein